MGQPRASEVLITCGMVFAVVCIRYAFVGTGIHNIEDYISGKESVGPLPMILSIAGIDGFFLCGWMGRATSDVSCAGQGSQLR